MGQGDVVKVMVPKYKPKSYSMSAERYSARFQTDMYTCGAGHWFPRLHTSTDCSLEAINSSE
jgi:hypothetical protein